MSAPEPPRRTIAGVEPEIFVLGLVSFFTDVSSELIFSVLAVFLTSVLGASNFVLGVIEGTSDFAASSLDLVSGYLSDSSGKRKPLALAGYGFSSAAKLLLLAAVSAWHVAVFRVVERLGKSIRGAPRDALIGAIASKERRGTSFGVHKALDRAGAVAGPLGAYLLLDRLGPSLETFRTLFTIALAPAVLAVLILWLFVHERHVEHAKPFELGKAIAALGAPYRGYLLAASIFSVAYFSFAFLLVNAKQVGFELRHVPLLYMLFNVTTTLVAIPVGQLGDRIGRRNVIGVEFLVYEVMLLTLIFVPTRLGVVLGFVLYGVFVAIDDGQSKAYITDLSGKESRATAFGIYNFVTGMLYVPASIVAGLLWDRIGPSATFGFAAIVTGAAALAFVWKTAPAPRA